jgi:SAM-dependent methyltransferase
LETTIVNIHFSAISDRKENSYDVIAELYDVDMGLSHPGGDIEFYVGFAAAGSGETLELGCGTGRITLPLIQAGCSVVGLDRSAAMLEQLRLKAQRTLSGDQRSRLHIVQGDMRSFALKRRFGLILCPYSAFNYMVEESDQDHFFEAVKRHLLPEGLFMLDTFVPHHDVSAMPDDHLFFDYRREIQPGLFLERCKTIAKDHTRQLSRITRYYRLIHAEGTLIREFNTTDTIRYLHQSELSLLLRLKGFEIADCFGDFSKQPYAYSAHMMVFVTRLRP